MNVQLQKLFFSDIELVKINDGGNGDEDGETTNVGKDAGSSTGTLTDVKVVDETKTSGNEEVIYAEIHKK